MTPTVMATVVEGEVSEDVWDRLEEAYHAQQTALPQGVLRTRLLHNRQDPSLWRIITFWRSEQDYEAQKAASFPERIFKSLGLQPGTKIIAHEDILEILAAGEFTE